MFVVTKAEAAAIRAVYEQRGEFERLVGDQRIGLHRGQQVICSLQVVCLAAGQKEADRIAQSVEGLSSISWFQLAGATHGVRW